MEVYHLLLGPWDGFPTFDGKIHAEEVNRSQRLYLIDITGKLYTCIHVFEEFFPVGCWVSGPAAKDVVNAVFEVYQVMSVFWNEGVNLVVRVVERRSHHGYWSAHCGSNKL